MFYEGCSKWIAYFYLVTLNFKLAQRSPLYMPSKYSPWLEMQSFSRCIHFLKASQYADLGTVIRYWWMADPSACRDWYFHPARNDFNFGNKKKSHGARSGGGGGGCWGKTVTFSFFKNAITIAEVRAGALSCRRQTCFKTSSRAWFLIIVFQFLQYYVFVVLSRDAFTLFSLFTATPSPEKKIAGPDKSIARPPGTSPKSSRTSLYDAWSGKRQKIHQDS